LRAVGVRTEESDSQLLWELEGGVGGKWIVSFYNQGKHYREIY